MKFEYEIVKIKPVVGMLRKIPDIDVEKMNETVDSYANDGWELDRIVQIAAGQGHTSELLLVFKKSHQW